MARNLLFGPKRLPTHLVGGQLFKSELHIGVPLKRIHASPSRNGDSCMSESSSVVGASPVRGVDMA